MAAVIEVGDDAFEREVLQAAGPVLVAFALEGCPPCRAIAPALDDLASKLKVVRVDVAKAPQAAARYKVLGVPTLVVVKGGQEVMRAVGALPKAVLASQVERAIA